MYYALMMSSDFKRIRSNLSNALAGEHRFVSNVIESGNAEKSFEKEVLRELWFLSPLSLVFGKTIFLELFAHKTKIFKKLMSSLKSISGYDRQRFFRSALDSYTGFRNKAVPLCSWLDEFEKNSENAKYCQATMYVMMCLVEEDLLVKSSSNDVNHQQNIKVTDELFELQKAHGIQKFLKSQTEKGD